MAFKRSSVRSRPAPPRKSQDSVRLLSHGLTVSFFQEHDCVRTVSIIPANSIGISDKLRNLGRRVVGCDPCELMPMRFQESDITTGCRT
jgi:hypothetical protein